MSLIANGAGEQPTGFYNGAVSSSLRMQDARLTKTPGSTGNPKKWTFSAWIKRGNLADSYIFAGSPLAAGYDGIAAIYFTASGELHTYYDTSGANPYGAVGSRLYRDISSWYHLVWAVDAANTIHKIWINNELVSTDTGKYPPNVNYGMNNSGDEMVIGDGSWDSYGSTNFNGYMAEINHCDGQYLEPDSFGETKNGVWIPLKDPSLTYGTNGFRLQFLQTGTSANSSGIGADTSGQDNHFAVNTLVAGDVVPDSPENNFMTFNPLMRQSQGSDFPVAHEGNLQAQFAGYDQYKYMWSTFSIKPNTGKWYFEVEMQTNMGSNNEIAYIGLGTVGPNFYPTASNGTVGPTNFYIGWRGNTGVRTLYINDVGQSQTTVTVTNMTAGQIWQFAIDTDTGKVWLGLNNSYYAADGGTDGNPSAGTNESGTFSTNTNELCFFGQALNYTITNVYYALNAGQDSSFHENKTAQGNTDANDIGDFYYAPPTGYKAICSANLPEPTIGPNSTTQADDHFNTVLWTGNGGTQSITGVGFQPDWIWFKNRSNGLNGAMTDSSRGLTKELANAGAGTEQTTNDGITAFGADGFSLGAGTEQYSINTNTHTYVAWNWKANGGTATATISESGNNPAAVVQANPTAGFSIITYTGTSGTGSIAHGLGAVPKWIIIRNRGDGRNWIVYHAGNTSAPETDFLILNTTAATADNTDMFSDTAPTSSVFTIGNADNDGTNEDNDTYVAYVFAEVEGYSKFGSYIGNGSTDGTFVHLGFRPAFLMYKRTDSTGNWLIDDNKTQTFNPDSNYLLADSSDAEGDTTTNTAGHVFDMLSNGFKMRNTNSARNASGGTFIYMAFAEAPFKYANAR